MIPLSRDLCRAIMLRRRWTAKPGKLHPFEKAEEKPVSHDPGQVIVADETDEPNDKRQIEPIVE